MASLQYKIFSGIISKLPIKIRLNILYFRRFGRLIDFDSPSTFNEKLQVKKLFDRSELLTIGADKIASKKFVKSIVPELYIPKTLWVGKSTSCVEGLSLDSLPNDYVFKANHTSQTIEIIRSSRHLSQKKMMSLTKDWLKHNQSDSLGEWAYSKIEPCVFVEEFLDFEGQAPDDFKFFVFHGKVHFIQLDSDRFTAHKRNIYTRNWVDLNFSYSYPRKCEPIEKPSFLDEMVSIAERIGKNYDFVRVDLYFYNGQITFGELTMYPGAGFEKFPSIEYDILFGKPWNQCIDDYKL